MQSFMLSGALEGMLMSSIKQSAPWGGSPSSTHERRKQKLRIQQKHAIEPEMAGDVYTLENPWTYLGKSEMVIQSILFEN